MTMTATITATTELFYTGSNFDEFLLELHTAGGMTAIECWNQSMASVNSDETAAQKSLETSLCEWMNTSTLSDWNIYTDEEEAEEYGEYTSFTVTESVEALINEAKSAE